MPDTLPARATESTGKGGSLARKLSEQQQYYASLVEGLSAPFNLFPWQFAGFSQWFRKQVGCVPGIIPDAHYVDAENSHVYLLEIVEGHDIDEAKARTISNVCWALDEHGPEWEIEVVVFYPRQRKTVVNQYLLLLEAYASRHGYRKAFTILTRDLCAPDVWLPPCP